MPSLLLGVARGSSLANRRQGAQKLHGAVRTHDDAVARSVRHDRLHECLALLRGRLVENGPPLGEGLRVDPGGLSGGQSALRSPAALLDDLALPAEVALTRLQLVAPLAVIVRQELREFVIGQGMTALAKMLEDEREQLASSPHERPISPWAKVTDCPFSEVGG